MTLERCWQRTYIIGYYVCPGVVPRYGVSTHVRGGIFSVEATYGSDDAINTRDDLLNSRLIIMWGGNPTDTVMFTNTVWYLIQAKEAGTGKIVCVDPRFTNTAALLAAQWIPIRPGTDAAMLIAMAYVI